MRTDPPVRRELPLECDLTAMQGVGVIEMLHVLDPIGSGNRQLEVCRRHFAHFVAHAFSPSGEPIEHRDSSSGRRRRVSAVLALIATVFLYYRLSGAIGVAWFVNIVMSLDWLNASFLAASNQLVTYPMGGNCTSSITTSRSSAWST